MKTFKIKENGEWVFNQFAYDSLAIHQDVITRLKLVLGELEWDLKKGIDWREYLNINLDKIALDNLIKKEILSVSGVLKILSYSSSIDTTSNKFVLNLSVQTVLDENIDFNNIPI